MTLKNLLINDTWSLFLDRDGVINKRIVGDYIKKLEEFEFLPGVLEATEIFNQTFGNIFIVTNQQGIGKGLMTEYDLEIIHDHMLNEIRYHGGRINKIYHSPYRAEEKSVFRKPNPGLARKAKIDFPTLEFEKSIMVGDSISDMEFGKNAGMYTVFLSEDIKTIAANNNIIDFVYSDLKSFADSLTENYKSKIR